MHIRPASLALALFLTVAGIVTSVPGAPARLSSADAVQSDTSSNTKKPKKKRQAVTVYVTRTGKKYHADGCSSLSKSRIPMSLEDAKASYDPCSKCDPPE